MAPLALIVGANRGIGLEFVKQFKEKGYRVIGACRKPNPELEGLADEVIADIDVGVDGSCDGLAKALGERKVEVAICNAGILRVDSLEDLNIDDIKEQLNVNTLGPLRVFQAIKNNLQAGSKYAILTSRMGSVADNTTGSFYGYRTSKTAVNMIGKCLAVDTKKDGVIVALLHPGYVDTDMTKGSFADKSGIISAQQSVQGLVAVVEKLTLETTGQFWHTNGQTIPW